MSKSKSWSIRASPAASDILRRTCRSVSFKRVLPASFAVWVLSCSPSPQAAFLNCGKKLPPLTVVVASTFGAASACRLWRLLSTLQFTTQANLVRALACLAKQTDTSDSSSSCWALFDLIGNAHSDILVTRPQERGKDNEIQINRLGPCCHFAGCQLGERRGFTRQETGKNSQDGETTLGDLYKLQPASRDLIQTVSRIRSFRQYGGEPVLAKHSARRGDGCQLENEAGYFHEDDLSRRRFGSRRERLSSGLCVRE